MSARPWTRTLLPPPVWTIGAGLLVGLVKVAVTVPFVHRYGWDRDELYFLAAGRHLAPGYVDFPPLVALLAALVSALAGTSLLALRLTMQVAGVLSIILVAFIARELGGTIRAQLGASAAWAAAPFVLGSGSLFHPTFLDLVCWSAFLAVLTRTLRREEPRGWLVLGVIAGVGLEAKYTFAALLSAVLVGLACSPERRILATRWPWCGLAVATALMLPNLAWEAHHGWVSLDFFGSQRATTSDDTSRTAYLAQGLSFLGAGAVVAGIGTVSLWRAPRLRTLAAVPVTVVVLFLVEGGRGYYAVPAAAVAVAAGAVALERWHPRRPWLPRAAVGSLAALHALLLVVVLPLVVAVRTPAGMVASGEWKDTFWKDEVGWPELTGQVGEAWRDVPAGERASTAILAGNYGEAGALARYGPAVGLPTPLSGHLSWQDWRPRRLPQTHLLAVGVEEADLDRLCARWSVVAVIDNRYGLANEERGRLIARCTLRRPLGDLWRSEVVRSSL